VSINSGIPTFARKGGMAFSINDIFYLTTGVTNSFRTKETWKNTSLVGVEGNFISNTLDIYPNPNNGSFALRLNNFRSEELEINIINVDGKIVYKSQITNYLTQFDSGLKHGIYFIKINGVKNKEILTKKIVIN
jgi:hypothetical protein